MTTTKESTMPKIDDVPVGGEKGPQAVGHTPGPWSICYDGQIDGPIGEFVCSFRWDSYKEFKQCGSDARLIASAPELLEVLKDLVSGMKELPLENTSASIVGLALKVNAAMNAIAKAEGRYNE